MGLNYVKFQRGSQESYNSLKETNRIHEDTLYFIYDKTAPEKGGLLYLGETLIGGSGTMATTLNQLADIDIPSDENQLIDGMILHYNKGTQKWEPVSIKTAIENSGAILNSEGNGINVNSTEKIDIETIDAALHRIDPSPTEGDITFVSGIPYIYDGTNWQKLTGTDLDSQIQSLQTDIIELRNSMEAVNGKIDGLNNLTYTVKESLPIITNDNVGDLSNTIFLVPNENGTERNIYTEYLVVEGAYERLGTLQTPTLSDYVTVTEFNNTVGDLEEQINSLQSQIDNPLLDNYLLVDTYKDEVGDLASLAAKVNKTSTTVVEEILYLNNRLQWHDINDDDDDNE